MATPFLSNSRIPMDLLLPVVKSFWALKGGYSSTTCQAFEIVVESNFANGGRSAYETYRKKDDGQVCGPEDLVCVHGSVSYVVGYLHSERHMVEKYQSLVEEKVGKFRSKSDTTIESWVQGIATNSATGH